MIDTEVDVRPLLRTLANLFETRAMIAARRQVEASPPVTVREGGRASAYTEAAREVRLLVERLS